MYNNLLGYIVSNYKTQKEFAKRLGISRTSLHSKLNGLTNFSQDDIMKCIEFLDLNPEEVIKIFLVKKFRKKEQYKLNKEG